MKWKILLTDGLAPISDQDLLASVELIDKKGISPEELLDVVPEMDAVIVRGRTKITEAVLAAGSKLKVVGRMGVGVDNIDLKAAAKRMASPWLMHRLPLPYLWLS
jgi:D-3-phosphoglycerate dehydrogenase / 2-oxoglutarate reductase